MKDKEFAVEKIRSQYMQQEDTVLEALKALDAKVKKPAYVFAFTYGSLGALVMGSGMSLVMTDLGAILGLTESLVPGTVIGLAGLVLCGTTYPIYKRILRARKKKYADRILELSEQAIQ